jgi:hypothetical protein
MALTAAQWNRLQRDLPPEDRMTYAEYLATINNLETIANNPESITAVTENLTDAANAARAAARDADAAELAALNAQANAALAEAQRLEAEADASAPTPVATPEPVVTPEPIVTPVEKIFGPSQFSKDGRQLEFKPITEGARLAIFGLNEATGKPYTDAEAAAVSGGYLPEGYKNLKGYRFDPVTGALEVLGGDGTTSGLGTGYKMNAKGNILPDQSRLPKGVGIDESGKYYQPGQRMPGESTAQFIRRLSQIGQGVYFENGKAIQYDSAGRFYIDGQEPMPEGFGQAPVIDQTAANLGTTTGPVAGKTISKTIVNPDKSITYFYSDGTSSTSTDFGGSSDGATAFDVFKNTLSLFFGPAEMNKPWVSQIYKTISGYTKSGSTAEEAFNMAILESQNNPALVDFTKRFKGIYALQKMKQEGKAVTVPTVAEYFATESKMGDILKASNLGDLANEDFLGDVLGKGVSATEFANRITNIFDRIDIAPDVTKKTIARYFPTLDRTQLARALALGERGAKQLQQDLAGYEVLGAAEAQGLGVSSTLPGGITNEQAQQIAKGGGTFASTLPQFGQIARARETEQKLAEISGVRSIGVAGLTDAVIGKSAKELKALEDLTMQEEARFAGKAGTAGSRALASQSRANRII